MSAPADTTHLGLPAWTVGDGLLVVREDHGPGDVAVALVDLSEPDTDRACWVDATDVDGLVYALQAASS